MISPVESHIKWPSKHYHLPFRFSKRMDEKSQFERSVDDKKNCEQIENLHPTSRKHRKWASPMFTIHRCEASIDTGSKAKTKAGNAAHKVLIGYSFLPQTLILTQMSYRHDTHSSVIV